MNNNAIPDANGAVVPAAVLRRSGLGDGSDLKPYSFPGAVVLAKRELTAMDMIQISASLSKAACDMEDLLADVCGPCRHCGGNGRCPRAELLRKPVHIYDGYLRQAGIPTGMKLRAAVNAENGDVSVSRIGYEHDLFDVPADALDSLKGTELCLGRLEDHLMDGDVIYRG